MTKLSAWKMAGAVLVLCAATVIAAEAQTFSTLAEFDGTDGSRPEFMSLVQGRDGHFYGMTSSSAFRISDQGTLNSLTGVASMNGLVLAVDGEFYGVATSTLLFSITANGALHYHGSVPGDAYGGLVQASDGYLYGTTFQGGAYGYGTIFKVSPRDYGLTIIHNFDGADGTQSYSTLIQATDGNFYGTTYLGGDYDAGTVFKITPTGNFAILHSFKPGDQGTQPTAGLVQASDGNLYGTTYRGGTVFRISTNGDFQTICSLDGTPYGAVLIQATDGNLYGTAFGGGANGYGDVVKITLNGEFTVVHSFDNVDGANPWGGLVQGTDGKLYGATTFGGDTNCSYPDGCGTVFSIDVSLGPFVAFVHGSGRVGQTGGILGQGFTGTTSVSLNGTPAQFTVFSDTFIRATVPPGATTGFVTVATPSGTLTSNVPFRVLQ